MADILKSSGSSGAALTRKGAQKSSEKRLKQVLLVVVLFACCAVSVYFLRSTMMTQSAPGQDLSAEAALQALQAEIDNEIVDIGETESDVTGISRASTMVMQTALLAEVSGRYPVAPASVLAPPPPPTSISLPSVEVIEPDPPEVTVIAIMITDSDKVAMVDVLGEVGGLIVRQGSSFAGGTAKVTKIDAKGVTFIWMKKSYTITVQ